MKHLFEFDNFYGYLNESSSAIQIPKFSAKELFDAYKESGKESVNTSLLKGKKEFKWTPTINLTDPSMKNKITALAYSKKIKLSHDTVKNLTYDYDLKTEDDVEKYCTWIGGVLYYLDNSNTIRFVFPKGYLDPGERCGILIRIPGLSVTSSQKKLWWINYDNFDKPQKYASRKELEVHPSCSPIGIRINPNSQKTTHTISGVNLEGGKLNIIVDMTNVNGYRTFLRGDGDPSCPDEDLWKTPISIPNPPKQDFPKIYKDKTTVVNPISRKF